MTRTHISRLGAAGGLLAILATGCASETETYCGDLAERRDELTELAASPDADALQETLGVLGELRDSAPADIEDEWSTLVFAYETLVAAFDAAGTSPGEYDPANPPEGVTESESRRIEGAAADLGSRRVLAAADGLEQHARDVCDVDLGLGSGRG